MPDEEDDFMDAINGRRYRNAINDLLSTLNNINDSDRLLEEYHLDSQQINAIKHLVHEALVQNEISWDLIDEL